MSPGPATADPEWRRSYDPESLFGADGALAPDIAALHPLDGRRVSAAPHANEGTLRQLQDVMEVTDRNWNAEIRPNDDHLAPDGRLMEILW
jgi:phosphoketolase